VAAEVGGEAPVGVEVEHAAGALGAQPLLLAVEPLPLGLEPVDVDLATEVDVEPGRRRRARGALSRRVRVTRRLGHDYAGPSLPALRTAASPPAAAGAGAAGATGRSGSRICAAERRSRRTLVSCRSSQARRSSGGPAVTAASSTAA